MTTYRLALYLGVGSVLSQFAQAQEVTTNSDICAVNAFTFDLYSWVARSEGNIFISPFVVHTALSMAYFGAGGETAVEMAKGLRLQRDSGHPKYRSLLNDLTISNSSAFELAVANGFFAQKGFQFAATFKEALDRDYGCILNDVDLTGWPGRFDQATAAAARKQINDWVAGQTHNRIQEVLPPSLPSPGTRLILASAIWFKGKWATPFDRALTRDGLFQRDKRESIAVPTMHQNDEFGYVETEIAQVLELPYAHDRFSMLVFLPKPNHTLNELENTMNEILPRSKLDVKSVILSIPRFKCSFHFDVTKTLRDMGVRNAFLPERADFSRITVEKPFFIEAVFQSAEINVDEEGTEAAAATAVAVSEGRPRRFNANRPFVFVMKDKATGVILFIGRIADPSKE